MTGRRALVGLFALTLFAPSINAQVPPDQQADMILTSAKKAQADGNFPFAIQRYGEFLQKFGNHPQANQARYQLAVAYLDAPERNFDKALEAIGPILSHAGLPGQPYALYYAGLCSRRQGLREVDGMTAKPNE